ncbi:MAG: response regulator [Verrucomicrobia bacterium]|nr:response regulator [Verrucomicrobiota bacterium]
MLTEMLPTAPPSVSPAISGRRTLLVCDDEECSRLSLRVVFKDDYQVLLAASGAEAIALVQQHAIDVAILDIRMGGLSGIETLQRLKQADPAIEVIMLTAFETVETARQALRLGACDYQTKPFNLATIRTSVANAIERRSLSDQIRGNTQQLLELQQELDKQKLQEEIVRTRGEIYGSIIHDMNGPLTIISGFVGAINDRIGNSDCVTGEDLELVKDRLRRIIRQLSGCIEISRRYLSFLRERSAPASAQVSVNHLLTDLWELLKFQPGARKHQLCILPLRQDATLNVNGIDVLQILLNLVTNAFQSSPHALRVDLHPEIQHRPLDLGIFVDGVTELFLNREGFANQPPLLALSVADNGPGIPAEILPRIFEPYFTTRAQINGSGLGLAIVQRLVKANRGALHVRTQAGLGSVFTIYLPAAEISADSPR